MHHHTWNEKVASNGLSRRSQFFEERKTEIARLSPRKYMCRAERERQKWRRITGMTWDFEGFLDARERRAHISRLARWIEKRVHSGIGNQRWVDGTNSGMCATGGLPTSAGVAAAQDATEQAGETPAPRTGGPARGPGGEAARSSDQEFAIANDASVVPEFPAFAETRNPELATRNQALIGCTTDWLPDLNEWARVIRGNLSVESICEELGISRMKLTLLLREFCGMSASEFIDGLKLRRLKRELLRQFKIAARELWGRPGYQAELLASGDNPSDRWRVQPRMGARRVSEGPNSKFFRAHPEDDREMNEWRKDIAARSAALREKLRQLRREISEDLMLMYEGSEGLDCAEDGLNLTALAIRVGFNSVERLSNACINVLGRSLEAIERTLSKEIVRYYIAAEDRTLREIASKEEESAYVARARYHYCGDDEKRPSQPYLDEWSKHVAFNKEWLKAMFQEFG